MGLWAPVPARGPQAEKEREKREGSVWESMCVEVGLASSIVKHQTAKAAMP